MIPFLAATLAAFALGVWAGHHLTVWQRERDAGSPDRVRRVWQDGYRAALKRGRK